jgi:hypothetical protein
MRKLVFGMVLQDGDWETCNVQFKSHMQEGGILNKCVVTNTQELVCNTVMPPK